MNQGTEKSVSITDGQNLSGLSLPGFSRPFISVPFLSDLNFFIKAKFRTLLQISKIKYTMH